MVNLNEIPQTLSSVQLPEQKKIVNKINAYRFKCSRNLREVWKQNFSTVITYFTLPESGVISACNSATSNRAYKTGLTEPQPKKEARPFSNRRNISPHFLASRLTDRTFAVSLHFPDYPQETPVEIPHGTQQVLVRVDMGPEGRQVLANEQFEIIFFVDLTFYPEEERGYLPFNYPLELS